MTMVVGELLPVWVGYACKCHRFWPFSRCPGRYLAITSDCDLLLSCARSQTVNCGVLPAVLRGRHSCPPHETAIMDADFIFLLEVGLKAFVVFVMWKSLRRPDEDLWQHFVTSCFSAYVTCCDRGHVQILHCQYRVNWDRYVSLSATYWKAAESVCLGNALGRTVDYLVLVCSQCQRPALHPSRQHLRNSLCFSEQSQKWFVVSDDGKLATPLVLVELLQSIDDSQSLFIDLRVVFLRRWETSGVVRDWSFCTIFHDVSQDGSDAIWRGITCQDQRLGRVEMCYHLWWATSLCPFWVADAWVPGPSLDWTRSDHSGWPSQGRIVTQWGWLERKPRGLLRGSYRKSEFLLRLSDDLSILLLHSSNCIFMLSGGNRLEQGVRTLAEVSADVPLRLAPSPRYRLGTPLCLVYTSRESPWRVGKSRVLMTQRMVVACMRKVLG